MNQPVYKSVNTHLLSDLANSFYNLGAILLSAEVVQMRASVRLRWETLSADRHLRTVVQATCDLTSLQPSLPHSRSTPELPQSYWPTWAQAPPLPAAAPHPQEAPGVMLCSLACSGAHSISCVISTQSEAVTALSGSSIHTDHLKRS